MRFSSYEFNLADLTNKKAFLFVANSIERVEHRFVPQPEGKALIELRAKVSLWTKCPRATPIDDEDVRRCQKALKTIERQCIQKTEKTARDPIFVARAVDALVYAASIFQRFSNLKEFHTQIEIEAKEELQDAMKALFVAIDYFCPRGTTQPTFELFQICDTLTNEINEDFRGLMKA
ncbi:MAG: hypothetical protein V3W41_00595 [Planctomycetota bacterium]